MKFWKTTVLFHIYKDKPPNVYMDYSDSILTAKDITQRWRNTFDYMGKNGIDKIDTVEISKEEWLAYWKRMGYDEPYGVK